MDLLERRRVVLLLVALSLAGLAGLYLYSTTTGPAEVPVGDLAGTPLGSLVATSGLLREPDPTSTGGLTFTLVGPEALAEVKVFVVPSAFASIADPRDLVPGTMVRVAGELQEFRGVREVAVTEARDVTILRRAGEDAIPLGYLAQAPWAFRGMNLVVRGRIGGLGVLRGDAGVVGTGFYITDGDYSMSAVVFGWDWLGEPRGVRNGAIGTFTGEVSYYPARAVWQLTSDSFTLELQG